MYLYNNHAAQLSDDIPADMDLFGDPKVVFAGCKPEVLAQVPEELAECFRKQGAQGPQDLKSIFQTKSMLMGIVVGASGTLALVGLYKLISK